LSFSCALLWLTKYLILTAAAAAAFAFIIVYLSSGQLGLGPHLRIFGIAAVQALTLFLLPSQQR